MITKETISYIYFVSGGLLFIWGWVQLGLDWGSAIAEPKTAIPTDALGLFTSPQPKFTIVKLLGWATVAEGVLLAIAGVALLWSDVAWEEIGQRRNYIRWIRWALTDAVFFAAMAFLLQITEVWVIISLALVAIGLNFAQAANETENAVIDVKYTNLSGAGDNRYDAWAVATVFFLFLAVLFDWKLGAGFAGFSVGVKVAILAWQVIYFILHLLILALTIMSKRSIDSTDREVVFEVARFLAIVILTISAYY